jgi:hypothetical protein
MVGGKRLSLLHTRSDRPRPALEPTQPVISTRALSLVQSGRGVELTTHPSLALSLRMGRAISLPPCVP